MKQIKLPALFRMRASFAKIAPSFRKLKLWKRCSTKTYLTSNLKRRDQLSLDLPVYNTTFLMTPKYSNKRQTKSRSILKMTLPINSKSAK